MNIRIIFLIIFISQLNFCYSQDLVFEKLNLTFEQPVDIVSTYVDEDSRLFVVEKTGKIFIIENPDSLNPVKIETPFLDLSSIVKTEQEGGLLGLAFSPEYSTKGYFFVNYTYNDPENAQKFTTRISRFNVSETNVNLADPSTEVEVMKIVQPDFTHNGGDLLFGPDEMLYIATGDGGGVNDIYENGQNYQSLLGKILRIDPKQLPYEVPDDNPFNPDPTIIDEIWALGLQNPWKMSFDSETGDLWIADVGNNSFEEINFQPAGFGGSNYGWNCFEGSELIGPFACIYPIVHTAPVFEYEHLGTQKSVIGGYVYRGSRHPDLFGKYICTDFIESDKFWIVENESGVFNTSLQIITGDDAPFRISTFGEDVNKELYFATFQDGGIWKVMTKVTNNLKKLPVEYFTISPNPVSDVLSIKSNSIEGDEIYIFNMSGQQLSHLKYTETINVESMRVGTYLLVVKGKKGIWKSSFVKI